jgi:Na+-transporting NADH:ubiquinone oxidoreductase subunit NqrB
MSRLASRLLPRQFWTDARHYQIAALATLLVFNFGWLDFGARPLNSALAIGGALLTQALCTWCPLPRFPRTLKEAAFDPRSPLITGLSLSLLLRADEPWAHLVAAVIGIGSKFVFRIDGKHIWNPAGFAIVALLLFVPSHVWISPGQWGSAVWFAALLCFFAILVLSAARRADVAIFFLMSHAALLLARAAWLGDPMAIPLHQLQSGSILIFAFFMISDPRTTPDARLGRFIFALAVAALGHYLAFFMQMRPALYVALIALSPLIILIDKLLPAERFAWRRPAMQGVSQ